MPFFHSKPDGQSNVDVFFAHYSRLLQWGSQLTHHDRAEAEDLVHDLYIRVVRISRRMDEIENLDSYLFKILRNLYYSRLRRAGRDPINDLSIVDYDSIEHGLATVDRRQLLFVRSHLREVCVYACQRKSTNRSAGILILRFFLGYFPSELTKIVRVPRHVVDQALHVARNEARTYLERPDVILPFALNKQALTSFRVEAENEDSHGLFLHLREAIFSASEGECFGRAALEKRYAAEDQTPLNAKELAHIVSCPVCLDQVNEILHLPLLAERSPEYGLDRDNTPGPGSGAGDGEARTTQSLHLSKAKKKTPAIHRMERRARDLFEHRPGSLQIVVDGDVRTLQKVTAEINELHLKLARKEEPAFIEVLSEQGFCMAFLLVDEPASADKLEQVENTLFSDDRSLVLTLSFDAEGPIVHVLYRDPVMLYAATEEFSVEPALDIAAAAQTQSTVRSLPKPIVYRPRGRFGAANGNLIARLAGRIKALFIDDMNPMLATAMICAVASIVFLVLSFRAVPVMKPNDLLQRAATSENAMAQSGASGVVVQTVRVRTPQHKVERTLYRDLQGKRRLKEQKLSQEDAALRVNLEAIGVRWNDPLSAGSYRDWHDHANIQRDVVKRPEKGLLTLTTTLAGGNIASESLTVREIDFRPVERTIELRDAGTVEIAELNYSVLPWNSVNPDLFEPEFNAAADLGRHPHAAILPHVPRSLNATELDEAELGVRLVLNSLNLDGNDRIALTRQPAGVHVEGVVEADDKKRQLQAELHMVPHVSASILTIQEMAARPAAVSEITSIQQSSVTAAPSPSALERYFADRGMDRVAAGASVEEFASSSVAVKRQSEQLSDLLRRFSSSEALSDSARAELSELLIQHKAALLEALGREERQLATLQLTSHSAAAASMHGGASELPEIAARNFALCTQLVSENSASPNSAQQIAPQLADSIAQLRAVVLRISAAAQMSPHPPASLATANQKK